MNLRFEFRVMTEEGECVVSDFTTFDPKYICTFGSCETVDVHTGAALRAVRGDLLAGRLNKSEVPA